MDAPSLHWGERTDLLPRRTAYVFSLDVSYAVASASIALFEDGFALPARARATRGWSTYHVFDEDLVTTADGVVREVPRVRVVTGSDRMLLDRNGVVNLNGRLMLQSEPGSGLSLQYGGVLKLPGLRARLRRLFAPPSSDDDEPGAAPGVEGTVFVATRHESPQTKFRWLVQNQLIGFGTARAVAPAGEPRKPGDPRADWSIDLSIDLYSAGGVLT